jgi:hypothetical protein
MLNKKKIYLMKCYSLKAIFIYLFCRSPVSIRHRRRRHPRCGGRVRPATAAIRASPVISLSTWASGMAASTASCQPTSPPRFGARAPTRSELASGDELRPPPPLPHGVPARWSKPRRRTLAGLKIGNKKHNIGLPPSNGSLFITVNTVYDDLS